MVSEEVDLADAGPTVVRCMERQNKRYGTTYPEITDGGMEVKSVVAMVVVAEAVMVEIPISPGGREVRDTEPIVSPLEIDVSTSPPIVAAVIP
jgi:hypothetical protein